jgi:RecJ-like exonuclease
VKRKTKKQRPSRMPCPNCKVKGNWGGAICHLCGGRGKQR